MLLKTYNMLWAASMFIKKKLKKKRLINAMQSNGPQAKYVLARV